MLNPSFLAFIVPEISAFIRTVRRTKMARSSHIPYRIKNVSFYLLLHEKRVKLVQKKMYIFLLFKVFLKLNEIQLRKHQINIWTKS